MNILIVNCLPEEYNTSSSLCMQLLCKGFLENDHKVWILSPNCDMNHKYYCEDYYFQNDKLYHLRYSDIIPKNTNRKQGKSIKKNLVGFARKIYSAFDLFGKSIMNLKYCGEIIEKLKALGVNFDIVLSTSDPKTSHLMANKIIGSVPGKPKYIQYWGDPLTLDIARKTLTPRFIRKRIEHSMLSKADCVAYVSPLTLNEQKAFFPKDSRKMIYSPTPCEIATYSEKKTGNDGIVLGYFGSYNSSVRNIVPLYNAVRLRENTSLYIVGDSDIKLEETKNIKVISRVSADQLKQYCEMCNVFVDLTNNRGSQIPAKIFRDAGSNREVLLVCDGEAGQHVNQCFSQYNRFTICSNTEKDIREKIDGYSVHGVSSKEPLSAFLYKTVSEELLEYAYQKGEKYEP